MRLLKSIALTLILIVSLSSLIIVGTVYAQSIPKPSVPEFPATLGITVLTLTSLAVAVVSRRKHLTGS
jgi:hypothetical protein